MGCGAGRASWDIADGEEGPLMTTGTGQQQPDLRAIVGPMIERLRSDGVTPGIEVGDRAPSFALSDAYGGKVALDDRLAVGPVVLSFYRGAWCPICNTELTGLQEALGRIKELGASLLAVSPQAPDASPDARAAPGPRLRRAERPSAPTGSNSSSPRSCGPPTARWAWRSTSTTPTDRGTCRCPPPVHHDVVVARLTLPRAHRLVVAGGEVRAVEGVGWEVVVALHHDGVVALGQYDAVPCRSNHRLSDLAVAGEAHWRARVFPAYRFVGGTRRPRRRG